MIVMDTNVLSELMRAAPAEAVVRWIGEQPTLQLFTTSITQAEIAYGIALMPAGKRRTGIEAAFETMLSEDFRGRILPFDATAAHEFPVIAAARRRAGQPMTSFDAMIASIARSRGATVATRNVKDFDGCGVAILDPWSD